MKRTICFVMIMGIILITADAVMADAIYDLCYAAYSGDIQKVEQLLKSSPELINAQSKLNGKTPLHYACGIGDDKMVKFLLSKGASVSGRDNMGAMPLHDAANYGKAGVINTLISNGAEVSAKTNIQWTPLHYAAAYGYRDVAEILILRGANLDSKDSVGGTPLHVAAENGNINVAELLIDKGSNVDEKTTSYNLTPLHSAVLHGKTAMVNFLISKGAQINEKDKGGHTPLAIAKEYKMKDIIDLLLKSGATE